LGLILDLARGGSGSKAGSSFNSGFWIFFFQIFRTNGSSTPMNENPKVAKKQELNMVGSFFSDEIHILSSALPDEYMDLILV
jgi:hypothetical protein